MQNSTEILSHPDVILICESWCNKTIANSTLQLSNYTLKSRLDRLDTVNGIGGGLLIYAKNDITIIPNNIQSDFNQFASIKVLDKTNKTDLTIFLIYRSPNSSNANIECLNNLFLNCDNNCLFLGDFNFPSIDWRTFQCDAKSRPFVDTVTENDFIQLVDFPTHIRGNILDLAVTNCPDRILNVEDVGNIGNSDHSAIMVEVLSDHREIEDNAKILNWKRADLKSMDTYIKNNMPDLKNCNDMDYAWNSLKDTISNGIDLFVPIKTKEELKQPIWASRYLVKLSKTKRKKWTEYCKNRTNANYSAYKNIEKKCKKVVRNCKRNYEKKISKSRNNNIFNSYIRSKTKSRPDVGPLKTDGKVITDNQEMAQNFNDYFASVFTHDDEPDFDIPLNANLRNNLSNLFFTFKDVKKKLKDLEPKHSSGPDGITNYILKTFREILYKPITYICNLSLRSNSIPCDWKNANVTPIHKKGTKGDNSNYRPISLTSVVCKIMESVMKDKIVNHIEENGLMRKSQFGFMKGKSTTLNLLEFFDQVVKNLDDGKPTDVIYLDFSKAFDKVSITKLLTKVRSFGICGKLYEWIKNWLTDRKQRVIIKGKGSNWVDVLSGVPQGSVLGPLLFLIYINDIDDCATTIDKLRKFADDTKLGHCINSGNDKEKLQQALDRIVEWGNKWKMEYNVGKCKVLHIGQSNPCHGYYMNGTALKEVENEKDLGIWYSKNLKPSLHCLEAARIAKGILYQIARNFHFRDKKVFLDLYKKHVRVHLEYASPAWSPFRIGDIEVLEKVQQKFVNMVSGLNGTTYEQKLSELDLPTLAERRLRFDMIQTFKIIKGIDKVDANNFFRYNQQERTRNNHPLNLIQRHSKTDTCKNFFSSRVIQHWNNLPAHVKNSENLEQFKCRLDSHLKQNR